MLWLMQWTQLWKWLIQRNNLGMRSITDMLVLMMLVTGLVASCKILKGLVVITCGEGGGELGLD